MHVSAVLYFCTLSLPSVLTLRVVLLLVFAIAAKTGKLQLDRAIVTREVGFYALAIFLLYIALQDTEPADDDELGADHIFVSFGDACMVFSGYILYVIVCANMETIVKFTKKSSERMGEFASYGTMKSTHNMVSPWSA